MNFLRKLTKSIINNYPIGILENNLIEYWESLSPEDIESIESYYRKYFNENFRKTKFGNNKIQVLASCIRIFSTMKNFEGCYKTLRYFESNKMQTVDVIDLHFLYIAAVDCLYRPKSAPLEQINWAKNYCMLDIDLVLDNEIKFREFGDSGCLPGMPAFRTLAVILENENKYEEAIELCKTAIRLGISDNTKGGYPGRLRRLEKKLREP